VTDFEEIYSLYFTDVYRYVLSLCLDPHLAEEITQETFFKAITKIDGYRGDCNIRVWLCQIAKHTYYSSIKVMNRTEGLDEDSDRFVIETSLVDSEKAQVIHYHLHHLEEPYKEVFLLKTFGELTYEQIAELFGKSESWARVTYHRARMKIKEKMK